MALDPQERIALREGAIRNWERACSLLERAGEALEASRARQGRAARLREDALRERLARQSVKQVIDAHRWQPDTIPSWGPLGVIAAASPGRLDDLEKALEGECATLDRALDGPTAVALAIVHQPDLTVLDDELDVLNGLEAGLGIQHYAPRCRVILLTSDVEIANTALSHGMRPLGKTTSPAYLREVAVRLIA